MTLQDSYLYQLNLDWTGDRTGQLSGAEVPSLEVAPPPEFSGRAGVWTPEHLLVASAASCLMSTFLAIAELSKLAVASFHMEARGRMEKFPGEGYRFTEIILAPEVGVASDDVERAKRLLQKAEKNCFITKSLRANVQVEPKFVSELAAATP